MISFLVRRMGSERASCDRKEEDILSRQAKNALTVFFFFLMKWALILLLQPQGASTKFLTGSSVAIRLSANFLAIRSSKFGSFNIW